MLYRITRADAADACLVVHFLPVELSADVRVIVYSTLAGEMGLITGPQARAPPRALAAPRTL